MKFKYIYFLVLCLFLIGGCTHKNDEDCDKNGCTVYVEGINFIKDM